MQTHNWLTQLKKNKSKATRNDFRVHITYLSPRVLPRIVDGRSLGDILKVRMTVRSPTNSRAAFSGRIGDVLHRVCLCGIRATKGRGERQCFSISQSTLRTFWGLHSRVLPVLAIANSKWYTWTTFPCLTMFRCYCLSKAFPPVAHSAPTCRYIEFPERNH